MECQYLSLPSKTKRILCYNKSFKKMYMGRRCFILGNGPSLNLYDLSVLKNEVVFCVNEFVRYNELEKIVPDYYLLADPKFFDLDENNVGDKELLDKFHYFFSGHTSTRVFTPLDAIHSIEKYGWLEQACFFKQGKASTLSNFRMIAFTRVIPEMQAVVQYAILLAVYMGFNEIYLIGTDQTNILGNIKAYIDNEEASEYAFELDEKQKKWKNQKLTYYSLTQTLKGYARIFELYELLGFFCWENQIKLYNCSPTTLIQGIPKYDFHNIVFDG